MTAETAERRSRVAAQLAEHNVDALLVSGLPNIRYLTGFTGSNGLLLLTTDSAVLFTDPRYTVQATQESDTGVVIAKESLQAAAAKQIARKRLRRIGVEKSRLTLATWLELKERIKGELTPLPGLIEQQRMVKSPGEIETIRRSVLTNSRSYERVISRLKPSATENDVAAEIELWQRRFGAERPAFESIVAAGPRSALPHARPTTERIGSSRLLLIDIGAQQSGYCRDMTRVVHLGSPTARAKKLYKAVLEAQLAAIDAVRPKITAGAVDLAARRILGRHGLADAFVHSTGHGLGLEIHETPRLGRRDKTRLQAGMVVTIEPGAYIEGFGGVRIEDTILVTENGCEILTPSSKDFLTV